MATKRKHAPKRSADQSTLTISLPKDLKARIENAARKDNRSTSNFLATELKKLLGILILAFLAFHVTRSPKRWSAAALKQTAAVAVQTIQHLAK